MHIRPTREDELDEVMGIYARARTFMAEHDNPTQWGPTNWPPRSLICSDIAAGKSYVCETDDGRLAGVFFYDYGDHIDPCYEHIEDGAWECDAPYGVVHRIASAGVAHGVGAACLEWALARVGRLRIDTHPDNYVLQGLLDKLGFSRRGIIHVEEDDMPRLAFERSSPAQLRATILTDDVCVPGLEHEWGLSVHVRYHAAAETVVNVLLDFGQSDVFVQNASMLGIDLALVDLAVLSHAHYDHADGMGEFLARNNRAPVCLSSACEENCWSTRGGTAEEHYIGIRQGLLEQHSERLRWAPTTRVTSIAQGVHVVPHSVGVPVSPLRSSAEGSKGMYLRTSEGMVADPFAHELTLVFELAHDAICVMSSCSHVGVRRILDEVRAAFPERRVRAFVGGLHLKNVGDEVARNVARSMRKVGIERLYVGHCTGGHALEVLMAELDGVVSLRPGLVIEL